MTQVGCGHSVRDWFDNACQDLIPDDAIILLENVWSLLQTVQQSFQPLETQLEVVR